jgi:hypothetical protein
MMDHRQGMRRPALELVKIQCRHGHVAGLMHNIGPDGMFILCEAVADVCDSVDISIALSGAVNASVRIPAIVVHRCSNGFGIMFRELDGNARRFVATLLACGKGNV